MHTRICADFGSTSHAAPLRTVDIPSPTRHSAARHFFPFPSSTRHYYHFHPLLAISSRFHLLLAIQQLAISSQRWRLSAPTEALSIILNFQPDFEIFRLPALRLTALRRVGSEHTCGECVHTCVRTQPTSQHDPAPPLTLVQGPPASVSPRPGSVSSSQCLPCGTCSAPVTRSQRKGRSAGAGPRLSQRSK